MIDRRHIGHEFPPFSSIIEAGRVRLFCQAIGETALIHVDARAARQAGYRNIVAPLTFPAAVAMDNPDPRRIIDLMEVDIAWILHGEEHYDCLRPICVGDEITTSLKIIDVYDKKNGALEFVLTELDMRNQFEERVCKIRRLFIVRRPRTAVPAEN
jgi:acyl dehydratase